MVLSGSDADDDMTWRVDSPETIMLKAAKDIGVPRTSQSAPACQSVAPA